MNITFQLSPSVQINHPCGSRTQNSLVFPTQSVPELGGRGMRGNDHFYLLLGERGGEGDGQPYHSNPTHRHVIYAHIQIPFSHTQPLENLKQETVTSVPIPFEENMTDTTN